AWRLTIANLLSASASGMRITGEGDSMVTVWRSEAVHRQVVVALLKLAATSAAVRGEPSVNRATRKRNCHTRRAGPALHDEASRGRTRPWSSVVVRVSKSRLATRSRVAG